MAKLNDEGQESILQEAHRLTHGDRNATYAHPFDDYSCTAALFSVILGDKLKSPITAHEMALGMCCVKLSRESRVPKRDNLVDLAGYAWVARMCIEEGENRERDKVAADFMAFGTGVARVTPNVFEHVPPNEVRPGDIQFVDSPPPCEPPDDGAFALHPDDAPLPVIFDIGGFPVCTHEGLPRA